VASLTRLSSWLPMNIGSQWPPSLRLQGWVVRYFLNRRLLFCPADHHIPDTAAFCQTVSRGAKAASEGAIVTFGVVPTFPSTAYGYIERGEVRADGIERVKRFIEKPGSETAQSLLLAGNVYWNAGIFLCTATSLLTALERHAPDIVATCRAAMALASVDKARANVRFIRPASDVFASCRAQSIDYAVMEKHEDVAVLPFAGLWSDVGNWNAVAALTPSDDDGNRMVGQGIVHDARDTYIHAPHRPVVALGTSRLLIVDTPDALLVADSGSVEGVREVVARLEAAGVPEAVTHRKGARPWGWYDSIESGPGFQVKRIGIKPGAAISLQYHQHRAEHWVVVQGAAEVTRGDEVFRLERNQSTYIPVGTVHRLRNVGDGELEIIEVQSGQYLGEDDIVRLEDAYGRADQ
jgi:mannose-1-phosphate guanylyltransferase/mannose-6-phosphate isomerase